MTLLQSLQCLGRPRLMVLGDLMLDRYRWGSVERVSPEAAVLVLTEETCDTRPGGAASAAALARGLDADVSIAGVLGADGDGRMLRQWLDDAGIDTRFIREDQTRPTTSKERFVEHARGRRPHQLLRVDREGTCPVRRSVEQSLTQSVVAKLESFQALLISDYGKGCCTPALLRTLIRAAQERRVPVLVDPARVDKCSRYHGASVLVPNRAEAALATGAAIASTSEALRAAQQLRGECGAFAVVVKLDSDGMVYSDAEGHEEYVPTTPRESQDVTGAGDMVLAMLGLAQAAGLPLSEAINLANVAAGLEVERMGVATVSRAELAARLILDEVGVIRKRVSLDKLSSLAESYRLAGKSLVLANGCFDLLHVGHVRHLEEAARLGDVLVVAVNSDRSVRRLKGSGRPVIGQEDRASLLAALACVDHVVVFDDLTPHELLRRLRPNVLAKGGTYTRGDVIGRDVVEEYGGRACVTHEVNGVSTTRILATVHGQEPRDVQNTT